MGHTFVCDGLDVGNITIAVIVANLCLCDY